MYTFISGQSLYFWDRIPHQTSSLAIQQEARLADQDIILSSSPVCANVWMVGAADGLALHLHRRCIQTQVLKIWSLSLCWVSPLCSPLKTVGYEFLCFLKYSLKELKKKTSKNIFYLPLRSLVTKMKFSYDSDLIGFLLT